MNSVHKTRLSICHTLSGVLLLSVITSCSGDGLPLHPVHGRVLVHGQSAENASIVFHPIQAGGELVQLRPRARTGPDGNFTLRTYRIDDGAPAGQYRVAIEWFGPVSEERGDAAPRPDRLRGRYRDPDTSGLTATVSKGNNDLGAFELE